jgi:hypothetical protein
VLWMVQIHAAAKDSQAELDPRLFDRCLRVLGAERSAGNCSADGWVIDLSVEAVNPRDAWISAMNYLFCAALESAIPLWPLVSVGVLDGEYAVASGRWLKSS